MALDSHGNLFIADSANNVIREVNATTHFITDVAGNYTHGYSGDTGLAVSAKLSDPTGVAVDSQGDLFIADAGNNAIREVNASTGNITTVAGNDTQGYSGDTGLAVNAELNGPEGVAVDSLGDIFIADTNNSVIREVNASTGVIATVAGTGAIGYDGDGGPAAGTLLFHSPSGVALDSKGDLFIADHDDNIIREITPAGVTTIVAGNGTAGYTGDGGAAVAAELNAPAGLWVDGQGNLYIADSLNNVVREVNASTGVISTVAGNYTAGRTYTGDGGLAIASGLYQPSGVTVDGEATSSSPTPSTTSFVRSTPPPASSPPWPAMAPWASPGTATPRPAPS